MNQHGPGCALHQNSDDRCRAAPTRCAQSKAARRVRRIDVQGEVSTRTGRPDARQARRKAEVLLVVRANHRPVCARNKGSVAY
jgi:hypothetical protein